MSEAMVSLSVIPDHREVAGRAMGRGAGRGDGAPPGHGYRENVPAADRTAAPRELRFCAPAGQGLPSLLASFYAPRETIDFTDVAVPAIEAASRPEPWPSSGS